VGSERNGGDQRACHGGTFPKTGDESGAYYDLVVATVLIFGAGGQLGTALRTCSEAQVHDVIHAPRSVDVSDGGAVSSLIEAVRPSWVINAAAMTNVDGAHLNPESAFGVNALGPGHIAEAASRTGARVIQISTEAVFSGDRVRAYTEDDACSPVSTYGAAKLAGEHLVRIYCPDSYVLRTSWLYAGVPGANFPTRLLEQLADPERSISVVTDVIGNPTPASVLARAIWRLLDDPPTPGTYHVCCTGAASKYDWAVEIARSSGFDAARIAQVTSDAYPTVARRPKHVDLDVSRFAGTGLMQLPTWQEAWEAERSLR